MTIPGDPLTQLTAEVGAIVTEVERVANRKSRWSGQVVIGNAVDGTGQPRYFGAKAWNCDIVIHHARLAHPGKYSSLVHEAFHSVSAGLNETDYVASPGYEEGIVEQCTRLFHNAVLTAGGLASVTDVRTSYNHYITLLEVLRGRTHKTEQEFYVQLLSTALADREATVLQWIEEAEPTRSRLQIEQETDVLRRGLKT